MQVTTAELRTNQKLALSDLNNAINNGVKTVILWGPAAVGKTTILEHLFDQKDVHGVHIDKTALRKPSREFERIHREGRIALHEGLPRRFEDAARSGWKCVIFTSMTQPPETFIPAIELKAEDE